MAARCPCGFLLQDPTKNPKPELLQLRNHWLNYKVAIRCTKNTLKEWIPVLPPAPMILTVVLFFERCRLTLAAVADFGHYKPTPKTGFRGIAIDLFISGQNKCGNSWVGSITVDKGRLENQVWGWLWWVFCIIALLSFYATDEPEESWVIRKLCDLFFFSFFKCKLSNDHLDVLPFFS